MDTFGKEEGVVWFLCLNGESSRILTVLRYTAIFEKNMINSTLNYLTPDWSTAVT